MPALAELAGHVARECAARWIEPRVASPSPDPQTLRWADLVVTLDETSRAALGPLPGGVRHRHVRVGMAEPGDPAAWQALALQLRRRIEGMAAGMRMLEAAGAPEEDEP